MSLTSSEMSAADLAAITGNSRANNGFGYDGGSLFYLIILFLFFGMFNGNWNNGGNGGGNYGGGNGFGLYPWMNQSNQMNDGFRDQMLNSSIQGIQNSITSGFGDVQNSLCGGFAGVNASIAAAQNGITQQMYANQIADMQQNFAMQSALQNCCCENRAQTADLKYTVATENCADRTQSMQNTRDIIESQTRNTQSILDKLCQLELDGVKGQLAQAQRENTGLQNQLNMANLAASQAAQTATFQQGMNAEVDALYNRLKNCPVPTQPVYGNQPIFSCNGNQGCGCGNGFYN